MLRRMSPRVARDTGAPGDQVLVPPATGSALSLAVDRLGPGSVSALAATDADRLLFAVDGEGSLQLGERHPLQPGMAALVPAGEEAELAAGGGLAVVRIAIGADATCTRRWDRARWWWNSTTSSRGRRPAAALSKSSSARTTDRPARRCSSASYRPARRRGTTTCTTRSSGSCAAAAGSISTARRSSGPVRRSGCRPREVHIVENAATDAELVVLGVFTPAGSPSAAYLEPVVAAEYLIG